METKTGNFVPDKVNLQNFGHKPRANVVVTSVTISTSTVAHLLFLHHVMDRRFDHASLNTRLRLSYNLSWEM